MINDVIKIILKKCTVELVRLNVCKNKRILRKD